MNSRAMFYTVATMLAIAAYVMVLVAEVTR